MELPDGWVPLSHFDSRDRGRTDGHSPDYKLLVSAVKSGELRGLQDPKSRRFYVPQDDANKLLINRACHDSDGRHHKSQRSLEAIAALTAALGAIATNQSVLIDAAERIASALEEISKRPLARLEDVGILTDEKTYG